MDTAGFVLEDMVLLNAEETGRGQLEQWWCEGIQHILKQKA